MAETDKLFARLDKLRNYIDNMTPEERADFDELGKVFADLLTPKCSDNCRCKAMVQFVSPKWISVSIKKPEVGELLLVRERDGRYQLALFDTIGICGHTVGIDHSGWRALTSHDSLDVTHWMRLPEQPE